MEIPESYLDRFKKPLTMFQVREQIGLRIGFKPLAVASLTKGWGMEKLMIAYDRTTKHPSEFWKYRDELLAQQQV